jgi:hypothetical protein
MSYIIDTNSKQITFLDNRFYSTENGGYVPSVTTILNAYPKDAGYFQWLKSVGEDADTIRDEAGRRGSVVHELTEKYDAGMEVKLMDDNGYIGYKLSEWSMFERYVDFCNRFQFDVLYSEYNFISHKLGFAGTVDRVININGKTILVDIKTSNAVYDSYWLQLAAYKKLLEEVYGTIIDEVAILWLNAKTRTNGKDGVLQGIGWQMINRKPVDTDNDWKLFLATQQLWLAQNGTMQPKKLSYSLTHKK